MATIVFVAAIGGFTLLLAATVILVTLNWSEKTLAPVLSIALVGTATTLASVLLTLKESTIESAFVTSVVLDDAQGGPPMVMPDPVNMRLTSRLSELFRLGHPMVNRDGKTTITIKAPVTTGEKFTFCGELLQYRLLKIIEGLQRGGWSVGQVVGYSTATLSKPMRLSKIDDYPGRTFLPIVAQNRFSDSDMERFEWEHGHFPLPRNTTVKLIHIPTSPATGPEKFVLRLQKPLFFQIDMIVEPLGGTGKGVLPAGLNLEPSVAARSETYQYEIRMHSTFEKLTAGNSQTQEYKDWANWLFSNLKEKLSD